MEPASLHRRGRAQPQHLLSGASQGIRKGVDRRVLELGGGGGWVSGWEWKVREDSGFFLFMCGVGCHHSSLLFCGRAPGESPSTPQAAWLLLKPLCGSSVQHTGTGARLLASLHHLNTADKTGSTTKPRRQAKHCCFSTLTRFNWR